AYPGPVAARTPACGGAYPGLWPSPPVVGAESPWSGAYELAERGLREYQCHCPQASAAEVSAAPGGAVHAVPGEREWPGGVRPGVPGHERSRAARGPAPRPPGGGRGGVTPPTTTRCR